MLRVVLLMIIPAMLVVLPTVGCKSTQPTPAYYSPVGVTAATASDMYPPDRLPAVADEWVCSMHPAFRMPRPGTCSLCGMDLVHASALPSTQESPSGSGHSHSSGPGRSVSSGSGGSCH